MRSVKVVVTGPVRAGTTSLIRSVSEIAVLTTERRVADPEHAPRSGRVVAMDFGRITVSDDLALYLFGTPGEDRGSLVGGPFADGMIGLIVTVDATRPASIETAAELVAFLEANSDVPYVIAANRMRARGDADLDKLREKLGASAEVPIVPFDAVQRASVKRVLTALMHRILETTP
jgi:uncharacterized protein